MILRDQANRKRFFSQRLRASLRAMERRILKNYGTDLDFDPISNGNDPGAHDSRIKTESDSGARAVVVADFRSHQDTERSVLRYFVVREDDIVASGKHDWRVSKTIEGRR